MILSKNFAIAVRLVAVAGGIGATLFPFFGSNRYSMMALRVLYAVLLAAGAAHAFMWWLGEKEPSVYRKYYATTWLSLFGKR